MASKKEKFILSCSFTEVESRVISKLSSESGATVATVVRALARYGLGHLSEMNKPYILMGLNSRGNSKNLSESEIQKIMSKFRDSTSSK